MSGTYTSSVPGRIGAFVGGLVITTVVAVVVPAVIAGTLFRENNAAIVHYGPVVLGAIGVVLSAIRAFVTGPVTIRTTPSHVEVQRGRRVRESWARDSAVFTSFVIRQSTNGIQTGSTRKMVVTTASERVEVICAWFSAKTFNALIADVAPLVAAQPQPEQRLSMVSSGTFTLDHRPVRRARVAAAVMLLIGLLAAVGFTAIGLGEPDGAVLVVVGGGLLLLVIVAGAVILSRTRIPQQLTVSPSTLTVDDRTFAIGQLTAITATPPNYDNRRRSLVLTDTTGRRTVINFGSFGNRSFATYGDFVEALRGATAHRPRMLTLDVA